MFLPNYGQNQTNRTESVYCICRNTRAVNRALRSNGWRVIRIGEYELARKNERRLLTRWRRFWTAPA